MNKDELLIAQAATALLNANNDEHRTARPNADFVRVQRVARRHRADAKREAGKAVRERMDAERDGRSGDALCASRAHAYWCARIEAIDDLMADVSPSDPSSATGPAARVERKEDGR